MFPKKFLKITPNGLLKTVINYINPPKADCFKNCKKLIRKKRGLEIGGPSSLFSEKGILPIYPFIISLDNCNFSNETIWDGQIKDGYTFKYHKKHSPGYQYIIEASELYKIESGKYDFVLSSHVIEHIANPIKALLEWIRVLKMDGILISIIPHKDNTFDHKRSITTLRHLIEDYDKNTGEDDLTHLPEVLKLHDIERDIGVISPIQFKERSLNNYKYRGLHHHVFNTYSAVKLMDYVKLQLLYVEVAEPYHIIIIAKKSAGHNNQMIISELQSSNFNSPFKSDKFLNVFENY